MRVNLVASRELLEEMLVLGARRIVGVSFEPLDNETEPTAFVTFVIDAPDAPDGAVEMSPIYQRAADGTVTMQSPGWIVR